MTRAWLLLVLACPVAARAADRVEAGRVDPTPEQLAFGVAVGERMHASTAPEVRVAHGRWSGSEDGGLTANAFQADMPALRPMELERIAVRLVGLRISAHVYRCPSLAHARVFFAETDSAFGESQGELRVLEHRGADVVIVVGADAAGIDTAAALLTAVWATLPPVEPGAATPPVESRAVTLGRWRAPDVQAPFATFAARSALDEGLIAVWAKLTVEALRASRTPSTPAARPDAWVRLPRGCEVSDAHALHRFELHEPGGRVVLGMGEGPRDEAALAGRLLERLDELRR